MPAERRPVRWTLEAAAMHGWLGACRRLPVARASALGAALGARLGPRLGRSRQAAANLRLALPELDAAARDRVLRACWANLGRLSAEYPHLARLADPAAGHVELVGREHLEPTLAGARPAVAVGAHLANFELLYVLLARLAPESLYVVRPPNNPWITGPLDRLRRAGGGRTSPKGRPAARAAVAVLRRNGLVLMLADQRMSEGIQARFFGHLAGAPPGPAHMALRHGAALLPVRMERVAPVRFRVTVEPPIPPPPADADAPARELTETIHRRFETWIRARPEDWLWLHRRWPKSAYDASPD